MTDENIYPRSGPARGLIFRLREGSVIIPDGRALLRTTFVPNQPRLKIGDCQWCFQPTGNKRRQWHDECARWYLAAKGQTRHAGGSIPLLITRKAWSAAMRLRSRWRDKNPDTPISECPHPHAENFDCAECGAPYWDEIDHRIPLSIGRVLRAEGDPRWWHAWTPGNLRPLCHKCHAAKTRGDRARLARYGDTTGDMFG